MVAQLRNTALVGIVAASLLLTALPASAVDFTDFHSPQTNAAGDTVYFAGNAPGKGTELWKSDGTAAGTVLVKDIYPGVRSGLARDSDFEFLRPNAAQFTSIGDKTYFFAVSDKTGSALWVTDGTSAGTTKLSTGITTYRAESETIVFEGELYFTSKDAAHGLEIWKSDGTVAGTRLAIDVTPGTNAKGVALHSYPRNFTVVGDSLVFQARDAAGLPAVYSTTDGATATKLTSIPALTNADAITRLGGDLVINSTNTVYTTDGTLAGTSQAVPAMKPYGSRITAFDGSLFYLSNQAKKYSLVRLTGATSSIVTPLTARNLAVHNGKLWYTTFDVKSKVVTLWSLASAASTPQKMADIGKAGGTSVPVYSISRDGALYFWSYKSLYTSDGTPQGTVAIKDFGYSRGLLSGMFMAFAGDNLVLTGVDWHGSGAMWVSDLTPAGTTLVLGGGTFTAPTPTITGSAKAGMKVSGRIGTWDPSAPNFAYQWNLDGAPIAGATNKTFTVPTTMTGSLTFSVTGTLPGYPTVTKTTAPKKIIAAFSSAPVPTITGSKVVGKYLRAVPGAWSPTAKFTYQWYANGKAIVNEATRSTYKVRTSNVSAKFTVKVTGSAPGYVTTTRTSLAR